MITHEKIIHHTRRVITSEEMVAGFARGWTIVQEEWAHPDEMRLVNELVEQGKATATPWKYKDGHECRRRKVAGRATNLNCYRCRSFSCSARVRVCQPH
jgi:hypothetical protein